MKKLILFMAFAIGSMCMSAQTTKVITGAVIDKYGNPLPNALVEATGGAESVMTDADGTFRIEVSLWLEKLTAKYAGCADKTLKIDNRSQLIFKMQKKSVGYYFLGAGGGAIFDVDGGACGSGNIMGGQLGNWGWYSRLTVPIGYYAKSIPSLTGGAIKQLGTTPKYLYFGVGLGSVQWPYAYEEDAALALLAEFGAMFRFNKVIVSVGPSINIGMSEGINVTLQASVGYCF